MYLHRMWALGKRVDIWDYFHFNFTFTFFFLHYSTLPLSLSPSLSVGLSLSVYFSPNSSPPHSLSSWEVFKIPTLCFQKPSLLSYLRFECRHKSQRFFSPSLHIQFSHSKLCLEKRFTPHLACFQQEGFVEVTSRVFFFKED